VSSKNWRKEADLCAQPAQPQSTAPFLAGPVFERLRFAGLTERTEKIGVVRRHDFVFLWRFGRRFFPSPE
jgi:hypothetical protein